MSTQKPGNPNERGVNVTVEYALTFAVALVLSLGVSGLLVSANASVNEDVAQSELDRVTAKVAAAAETAEYQYDQTISLSNTTGITAEPHAAVYITLPETILDTPYTIRIDDGDTVSAELNQFEGKNDPQMNTTPTVTRTLTAEGGTAGGPVKVYVDSSTGDIVITSNPQAATRPSG